VDVARSGHEAASLAECHRIYGWQARDVVAFSVPKCELRNCCATQRTETIFGSDARGLAVPIGDGCDFARRLSDISHL
jgi:hypothetical protein